MRIPVLLATTILLPFFASASLISVAPQNATQIVFDGGGTCNQQPQTATDAGFTITTDGAACFPYSQFISFDDNGIWDHKPGIHDDSGFTTLTINLGGYFSSVGGFLNYDES